MRCAAMIAFVLAAVLAGCGGGGKKQTATAPAAHEPAPVTSPAATPAPTATTNTPPTKHRTKPQPTSTQPLQVSSPYTCRGKRLHAIRAVGPVAVKPAIVKPGQSFTVTVTDPSAKVAVVSLAGVSSKPIQVSAKPADDHVAATLEMPAYATCGNKLLEVEGDVSAEAYVGVAR